MPKQTLKIVYSFNPELDPEEFKKSDKLDRALEKVAKEFGFKEFEGSGYNFKTKERDMSFKEQ